MSDILFGNNNKAVVKKIAARHMKANKVRNLFVILAVILTTVLFAAFFSIGGGLLDQIRQIEQRQYGTAHASVKFLTQNQYRALERSAMKEEISYTRLVGMAVNRELAKLPTEVRLAGHEAAESFLCAPDVGGMPQREDEIAVSTLILDALEVPHQLGAAVSLKLSVDGEVIEKKFILCGFWEGYALASAQEVWVSQSFADGIAPASHQTYEEAGRYAGLFCADISFAQPWNIQGQLDALLAAAGIMDATDSINPAYESVLFRGEVDLWFLLAAAALLGTILLAGYLIIYNLFYISVTQDVHFFGLLRTIGASGKQLRGIVWKQAFRLALIGLPVGLLIGWLAGRLLLPFVLTQINVEDTGIYRINPLILLGAAIFALLTVWISSCKPCRFVAKIPAVEAVRYSGDTSGVRGASKKIRKTTAFSMAMGNLKRSWKKAVLVVLSLFLSLVLLNTTYTAVHGFDVDAFIAENVVADFYVTDFSVRNSGYGTKNLSGVSENCLAEIKSLPGLENSASIYGREIRQSIPASMVKQCTELSGSDRSDAEEQLILGGSTGALVYGVDQRLNDKITLTAGEWDPAKWATGNYVIVNDFYYEGILGSGQSSFYQIGDSVALIGEGGVERLYTVMGIGSVNYNLDAQYWLDLGISMILPETAYQTLYGATQPLCTVFNVEEAMTENAENWIRDYCENAETNLTYISRSVYQQEFERDKTTYVAVGGILTIILALIGLLNFVNAVATSMISRQREMALLAAIGMGQKQLRRMLIVESIGYVAGAFLLTVTAGTAICYFVCINLVSNMWAFEYRFTLAPVLLCMPFLLAAAIVIPLLFHVKLSRKSVVERLCFAE